MAGFSEIFPEYAHVKHAAVVVRLPQKSNAPKWLGARLGSIFSQKSHQNLIARGEGPLPDYVVEKIGRFVLERERGLGDPDLPGIYLRQQLDGYAQGLMVRSEHMREDSRALQYHDAIHYRNQLAREFVAFSRRAHDVLDFVREPGYTTRRVKYDLRKAFVGFRIEMEEALPSILQQMRHVDREYEISRRSRYPERAIFY